jgi:S1-C subfamily serine protease
VTNGTEKSVWTQLSGAFANTIADLENSIVAIDGGGRSTTSGVVWQPGVIVTTHHGLRLRENIQIIFSGESLSARLIGSDAATDLAVLGIDSDKLTPAQSANDLVTRTGEVVLSVPESQQQARSRRSPSTSAIGWGGMHIEGYTPPPNAPELQVDLRVATPSYFSTMESPLVHGRMFAETDTDKMPPVATDGLS